VSKDDPFFRLLCVDDNPTLLQALALGFRAYGFQVITAANGIDALMQFQAHAGNFGAVLADNDMPHMNGLVLVKHLRALGYRGCMLIMSGHLTASEGRAYQDYAVSGFLHKPFEISMVATMLMYAD
jgi:two-component system, cell cycle sensor histidine kinase and response regulator CckA